METDDLKPMIDMDIHRTIKQFAFAAYIMFDT